MLRRPARAAGIAAVLLFAIACGSSESGGSTNVRDGGGDGSSGGGRAGGSGVGGSSAGGFGTDGSTAGSAGNGGSTGDAAAGGFATDASRDGGTWDAGSPSVGFSFSDPSGTPATKCQTFANPLGDGVAIAEVGVTATPGLTALWINRVAGAADGALADCAFDGSSIDATTIYFGQALNDLVTAPAGVAFAMGEGEGLRVGSAFRNLTGGTVTSSVEVSLRPAAGTFQSAGLAFLPATALAVPPMTTPYTASVACPLQAAANLFGATGHVLLHGTAMTATLGGGPALFQSDPWDSATAAAALHAPAVAVTSSSSVSLSCTYSNPTARTLRFGLDYAQDEQCSIFLYYYPATSSPLGFLCN